MRLIILFFTIIIGLTTCRKDKIQLGDFMKCNAAKNLDSPSISAKLIGSWTWKKQSIPYSNKFRDADKNIKVTFNVDSTFSMVENSIVVMQGTWKLIYHSVNEYWLETNEYSQYLGGAVYFCDNQLLFVWSPADGVDNLFEK